jgi:hypothetical protein
MCAPDWTLLENIVGMHYINITEDILVTFSSVQMQHSLAV